MKSKYRKRLAEYREFVEDQWPAAKLDWSEAAAIELYTYESTGRGSVGESNGYAIGKKWIDWQIDFWTQELGNTSGGVPLLTALELKGEPIAHRIPAVSHFPQLVEI